MLVLSFSVRTTGDVTCIVSVRIDLVLVTAIAASPGHWLTVYVSAAFSYWRKKKKQEKRKLLISEMMQIQQRALGSVLHLQLCRKPFSHVFKQGDGRLGGTQQHQLQVAVTLQQESFCHQADPHNPMQHMISRLITCIVREKKNQNKTRKIYQTLTDCFIC